MFRKPLVAPTTVEPEPTAAELRAEEAIAIANRALATAKHRSDANRRTMTYLADKYERIASMNRTTVARQTHNDNRIGSLTSDLAALTARWDEDGHSHPTEADDALAEWQAHIEEQLQTISAQSASRAAEGAQGLRVFVEALRQYQEKLDDFASTVGGRLDTIDTCIDGLARRLSEPEPDLERLVHVPTIEEMEVGEIAAYRAAGYEMTAAEPDLERPSDLGEMTFDEVPAFRASTFEPTDAQRAFLDEVRPVRQCRNEYPHPSHVTAYKASSDTWLEALCPGVESYEPFVPEPGLSITEQQARPYQEDGELEARHADNCGLHTVAGACTCGAETAEEVADHIENHTAGWVPLDTGSPYDAACEALAAAEAAIEAEVAAHTATREEAAQAAELGERRGRLLADIETLVRTEPADVSARRVRELLDHNADDVLPA